MSLIDRVRRTLQRHRLTTPDTRVVVALSGGPDSMALLHILRALADRGDLHLAAVAHVNHQLREASDADAQFCATVAAQFSLPFRSTRVDVRARAAAEDRSIEDAAHHARRDVFEAVGAEFEAVVAVGHTLDDQAETFLLRLVRGAGSHGLSAMHPRSGVVIRPLLECARSEVRAFVESHAVAFVHDATNDDVGIPRNRVRAELLPLLAARFNPSIAVALASAAELARAEDAFLEGLAAAWCDEHAIVTPGRWTAAASDLTALPLALARRVVVRGLSSVAGSRLVGFSDVERTLEVAAGDLGGFDAPGQRVDRRGADVVLTHRPAGANRVTPREVVPFSRPLPVPGEVELPEVGCVITAEVADRPEETMPRDGYVAAVSKDKLGLSPVVRNRRPGDRLKPSPAGHRKLQDLFVDRKVPRAERDRIPVVVSESGQLVWVPGHAVDEDFRVTDPAQAVVILRLKGVGGSC
jgi:tRNA(Ile)-lysidine synthase